MKYVCLLLIFVVLSACVSSKDRGSDYYYEAILIPKEELVISYPKLYYPIYPNFRIENGKKYLAIYETQKRQILSFSMEDGQLLQTTAADFNPSGKQHLYSFHYHNDDSIFLGLSASPHPNYWHDSCLIQINKEGLVQKVYPVYQLPVRSSLQADYPKDCATLIAFHKGNIHYEQGRLHLLLSRYRYYPGDSMFEAEPMPIAAYIDLSDKAVSYYPLRHKTPADIIGKGFLARNYNFVRWTFNESGSTLFGFGHTSMLYLNKIGQSKVDSFRISSLLTDSLWLNLYPEGGSAPQFDYQSAEYLKLYRDPYQERYARVFRLADSSLTSNPFDPRFDSQHSPAATLILFNEAGEQLGETLIPEGYSIRSFFFDEDGIWLHNREKSMAEKKLVLQKFAIKKKRTTKAAFQKEVAQELTKRARERAAQ